VCGTERTFRDSGDWREGWLISVSGILFSDEERPRLLRSEGVGDEGERMPKNSLGDHWAFSHFGERDRADPFLCRTIDEVFNRGRVGVGGARRGVMYLSAGFMVLRSAFAIELIDALRKRSG
jgi:hypothetical protein